jgi:hypothetical protein
MFFGTDCTFEEAVYKNKKSEEMFCSASPDWKV